MANKITSQLQYFVLIASVKQKEKMSSLLNEYGGQIINTNYANGSANVGVIAQAFGIEVDQKKVVITSLIESEKAQKLIEILYNEYKFSQSNTGIAYTIPVQGLMF